MDVLYKYIINIRRGSLDGDLPNFWPSIYHITNKSIKMFPFPNRSYRMESIQFSSIRPRHYVIFFLFLYILLECITVGGSISPQTRNVYVAKLTYKSSDNTKYFHSDSITQLDVRVGYFATCLKVSTNNTHGDWSCSRNENRLLQSNPHFNSTSAPDKDLYNFFQNTAYMFRHDCMSPWILVVAILLSFVSICVFAWSPPYRSSQFYRYSSYVCYLAFSLSLVAAVWQETNTVTGTKLMKVMVDDYYSLSTHYGTSARVMVWIGVALTFLASLSLFTLAILAARSEEQEFAMSGMSGMSGMGGMGPMGPMGPGMGPGSIYEGKV